MISFRSQIAQSPDWFPLGVSFRCSDKHSPRPFHTGVPPPPPGYLHRIIFFRSCSGGKLPAGSGGHVGSYNWWRRKHVECGNWITRPREEGRPTYYFFLACPISPPSHIILVAVCFVLYNVFQLSVKARLNATANITSCMACFVKIVRFWLVWIITTQNITLSLYLIPRRKLKNRQWRSDSGKVWILWEVPVS